MNLHNGDDGWWMSDSDCGNNDWPLVSTGDEIEPLLMCILAVSNVAVESGEHIV